MLADPLDEPALVIYDGSPPAAAAVGLIRQPAGSALWLAPTMPGLREALEASAHRLAEATGVSRLERAPADRPAPQSSLDHARLLLDAAEVALRLGLASVIHAAALGDADLDAIAAAVDRCALATALASLDSPARRDDGATRSAPIISAPLVDLTDAQIAELLMDLALPVELCLICQSASDVPCQACPGCRRWAQAMESARQAFRVAEALPPHASH